MKGGWNPVTCCAPPEPVTEVQRKGWVRVLCFTRPGAAAVLLETYRRWDAVFTLQGVA